MNDISFFAEIGETADKVIKSLFGSNITRVKSEMVGRTCNGLTVRWYMRQGEEGSSLGVILTFKRYISDGVMAYRVAKTEEWNPCKIVESVTDECQ